MFLDLKLKEFLSKLFSPEFTLLVWSSSLDYVEYNFSEDKDYYKLDGRIYLKSNILAKYYDFDISYITPSYSGPEFIVSIDDMCEE